MSPQTFLWFAADKWRIIFGVIVTLYLNTGIKIPPISLKTKLCLLKFYIEIEL